VSQPLPTDIFHQGQVLNNTYEIEAVIGRGGTGEVYRARNLVSGRIVAVKALSRQFSGNEDYIELMRREEQMRDISHDAVVRYTECSRSDDGHVFLVMDYIDGPSLQEALGQRRLDPHELLIVAHRVADGLQAAHRRGIVHRDLSPDNIILRSGEAEKATLIDFGIAKDTTPGARTIVGNDFAGKYEYAAPEQLEGRVDARSDLYALGASLLAAFRGSAPFAGSTPGEIVRRKRQPLDTEGVPQQLRGIIERLSAPDPSQRPSSAGEAMELIERALKLGKGGRPQPRGRGVPPTTHAGGRTPTVALGLVVAVALAGGGLWWTGWIDRLITPELPLATPYRLSASVVGGPALSGNAPDEATAATLRRAFEAASGSSPPETALTLAQGVPSVRWATSVADLIEEAGALDDWTLEVSDTEARLNGLAPDLTTRDRLATALGERARAEGLALTLDLAAGPRQLAADSVTQALTDLRTCGALSLADPPMDGYRMDDTVVVRGEVAEEADIDKVRQSLVPLLGDRRLELDLAPLNPSLCRIRNLLPPLGAEGMSIRLSDGVTGEANLSGVFHVGNYAVVDVELPATHGEDWLWVVLVTNTGEVYNLLPRLGATEHQVGALGAPENGLLRVGIIPSPEQAIAAGDPFVLKITDKDFGKNEFFVFLTREPLFDLRPGRGESVAAFSEALEAELRDRPGNILAVVSRVIETRP
jgi:predicted Ser/Thr protein kinase